MLFQQTISNLADWAKVFQDKEIFEPFVKRIFQENGMIYEGIDNCTPGSNAVFRSGKYIVKIFAPEESEIGGESDYITEKYGLSHANRLHIAAPKLYADGVIEDKYIFRYLLMEYVEGQSLADISDSLSAEERIRIGRRLREAVERMDTECEPFNSHMLFGKMAEKRWGVFPESFQKERAAYLNTRKLENCVFVHGDLNPDNIIINDKLEICVIDFADALIAPVELELAGLICDGVKFDPDYLQGFWENYDKESLTEQLVYGLMLHDYGANIIRDNIGNPAKISSLQELRERILEKI